MKVSIKANDKDLTLGGKYKSLDDDAMEIVMEFMGEKKTEKVKIVKIPKDEMTTPDEMKKEESFIRLK